MTRRAARLDSDSRPVSNPLSLKQKWDRDVAQITLFELGGCERPALQPVFLAHPDGAGA